MLPQASSREVSISDFLHGPLRSLVYPVEPALRKLTLFDRLERIYGTARGKGCDTAVLAELLQLLKISYEFIGGGPEMIPAAGPVLVVANHPFGLLEGAILATVLPAVRPDLRVLANSILSLAPELRDWCIFADPFGWRGAARANARALKECLTWLDRGGLLVAFPAGEVAHFRWKQGCVTDPPWNPAIARIAQKTAATVVPVFFRGANSLTFQLAGTVHPRLRTMSLPRELLNKQGKRIQVTVGRPVPAKRLRSFADSATAIEFLRCRTFSLGEQKLLLHPARKKAETIPAIPSGWLRTELARLSNTGLLCEYKDLAVVLGRAMEMPDVMREIGRLREISFRNAGEGTGREVDLDRFDPYYLHLVLWNRKTDEVVGAYRLGETQEILPRYGVRGLYTSTLFHYRISLFDALGPALELGRSFIRPEYQRQFAPLMLLWKGIGRYAAARRCGVLFGAVSISDSYQPLSRQLMVRFLSAHRAENLADLVSPRRPYHPGPAGPRRTQAQVGWAPSDIEEVSALVSDIEADGKGVPILVKHYYRAGGKLLGLSVDPHFSNVLDALIMVDLGRTPRGLMERYLGAKDADMFSRDVRPVPLSLPGVPSVAPAY